MGRGLLVILAIIGVCLPVIQGFYSVGFVAPSNRKDALVNGSPSIFAAAPDAVHVADLVARLNGHPPLLREESMNLPSFTSEEHDAIVLELEGGVLPREAQPIVKGSAFPNGQRGPQVHSVLSSLNDHGIQMQSHKMKSGGEHCVAVSEWIKQQNRPVIILQHETENSFHHMNSHVSRQLLSVEGDDATTTTAPPLTEFQISQYQICLWSGLVMVILLASAICSISNMEVIPDSLLYAKFQSARAQKND